ncbi:MAG TPA: enoyl-CoA hydratase/isomerase family protein [Solirubrobacteraceae bacterium]|jgi:enoyl-CoA hydratase/carnithine racemase|nr:enoyl-CoA hydratase/isomerase family protein [Solirubrobacteraceae bacterium]
MTAATTNAQPVLRRRDGQIGHITLNRPQALNTITADLAAQLEEALSELAQDSDAIIIRGAGGSFCAGADLKFVREHRSDAEAMRSFVEAVGRTFELIETLPIPVVAAVEGHCIGGGFELLQACDFAVAAEDAVIADGHVQFGQIPGAGSMVRLGRLIGRQAAFGILLSGQRFSGAQAAVRGLVHQAFPPAKFEQCVAELAADFRRRGRDLLRTVKQTMIELEQMPIEQALAREREAFLEHVSGPVAGEGLERFVARTTK